MNKRNKLNPLLVQKELKSRGLAIFTPKENVAQLALDLGQPIKFENVLSYYVVSIWPTY